MGYDCDGRARHCLRVPQFSWQRAALSATQVRTAKDTESKAFGEFDLGENHPTRASGWTRDMCFGHFSVGQRFKK